MKVKPAFSHTSSQFSLTYLCLGFAVFGKSKWNGHELKVQLAKEDFMER